MSLFCFVLLIKDFNISFWLALTVCEMRLMFMPCTNGVLMRRHMSALDARQTPTDNVVYLDLTQTNTMQGKERQPTRTNTGLCVVTRMIRQNVS